MTSPSLPDPVLSWAQACRSWDADPGDAARWRRQIRKVVTQRILPSLEARQLRAKRPAISPQAVVAFASLLLASPLGAAVSHLESLQGEGLGFDDVMLLLLGPAARRLGDLWLADRLSFFDVTRGSAALQALVRHFGPAFEGGGAVAPHGRAVLLAPVPGEQHVLGLSMIACLFRRAGWHVAYDPGARKEDILARLDAEPFDLVGLSASGTRSVDRMPGLVSDIKAASRRVGLRIIAGGALLLERHKAGESFGTDGVAQDAREALEMAQRLVLTSAHPS